MDTALGLLKMAGVLAAALCMLFGLFIAFHILRPQKAPADSSNRINKIRLLWFCLTREDLFVDTFPWLRNDELENVTFRVQARDRRTGQFRKHPDAQSPVQSGDMFDS